MTKIDNGTYGIVRQVQEGGRDYAEKQYHDGLSPDTVREMVTMSSFRHPHIMPAVSHMRVGGRFCTRMPLGTMLVDYVHGEKATADLGGLMAGVMHALHFLHRHRVIHGDLKPNNVIVVDGRAMLADFGASMLDYGQGKLPMCAEFYRAPEIPVNTMVRTRYGCSADMWSFGKVVDVMIDTDAAEHWKQFMNTCLRDAGSRLTSESALKTAPIAALTHHHLAADIQGSVAEAPARAAVDMNAVVHILNLYGRSDTTLDLACAIFEAAVHRRSGTACTAAVSVLLADWLLDEHLGVADAQYMSGSSCDVIHDEIWAILEHTEFHIHPVVFGIGKK